VAIHDIQQLYPCFGFVDTSMDSPIVVKIADDNNIHFLS